MENKFKNQILSEDLQNITIENQEEPSKHGEEEETEDTTRYGEFVTSYFAWVPMSKQKQNTVKIYGDFTILSQVHFGVIILHKLVTKL